jgi:hypothetical protein
VLIFLAVFETIHFEGSETFSAAACCFDNFCCAASSSSKAAVKFDLASIICVVRLSTLNLEDVELGGVEDESAKLEDEAIDVTFNVRTPKLKWPMQKNPPSPMTVN